MVMGVREDNGWEAWRLLEETCVSKIEDLSVILERSPSSAERYLKQAIESEVFSDRDWKNLKSADSSMLVNLPLKRIHKFVYGCL